MDIHFFKDIYNSQSDVRSTLPPIIQALLSDHPTSLVGKCISWYIAGFQALFWLGSHGGCIVNMAQAMAASAAHWYGASAAWKPIIE